MVTLQCLTHMHTLHMYTHTHSLFPRLTVPYPRPPMRPRPGNTRRARAPRGTVSNLVGEPHLSHSLALVKLHNLASLNSSVLAAGNEIPDIKVHFSRKPGQPGVGGVCLVAAAPAASRTEVVSPMTNSLLPTCSVCQVSSSTWRGRASAPHVV